MMIVLVYISYMMMIVFRAHVHPIQDGLPHDLEGAPECTSVPFETGTVIKDYTNKVDLT